MSLLSPTQPTTLTSRRISCKSPVRLQVSSNWKRQSSELQGEHLRRAVIHQVRKYQVTLSREGRCNPEMATGTGNICETKSGNVQQKSKKSVFS